MIDILLLDDDPKKIERISIELKRVSDTINIITTQDIISAKRLMTQQRFDMLLLDIQIPNRFGQSPQRDGGLKFLQELLSSQKYLLPIYIVGITAYEDIYSESSPKFSEKLWEIVMYDDQSYNWVSQVTSKVKYLIDLKMGLRVPIHNKYEYDLAIVTALDKIEMESVKKLSTNWEKYEVANDGMNYYSTQFIDNNGKNLKVIAASAPEMGMVASSVTATKIIYNFCPRYLVMVGIAAGVKGKVNIGDVMVADPSWDYGSGKTKDESGVEVFQPDPRQLRLDADIKAKFQVFVQDRSTLDKIHNNWIAELVPFSLNVHVGPVASGAAVVANGNIPEEIADHNRNIIGIDMETYGVFYAAVNSPRPKPLAFSMKSVCDFADTEKDDRFQYYAAYTSATAMHEFVVKYLFHDNSLEI
jgi:nucleoside phosphorylase/CheY-like chemotaxis protein